MRNLTKLFCISIVLIAFAVNTFGQVQATAAASASIVSPITIALATDMEFGNVAVSAALGTVILTPAGTRSATGGVTLPAITGTVSAASFDVSGTPAYTYSIGISPAVTTITNGAQNMTIDTWTSTPTVLAGGTLDVAGDQTVSVGGTLHVAGNQASGTYTNATGVTVTVNYN